MAVMNVSLTQQLEKFVNKQVASGRYQTASEVVREGLRLMQAREEKLADLRREIQIGLDAIARGEIVEYDPRRIKALGRRRLEQLRKQNARG